MKFLLRHSVNNVNGNINEQNQESSMNIFFGKLLKYLMLHPGITVNSSKQSYIIYFTISIHLITQQVSPAISVIANITIITIIILILFPPQLSFRIIINVIIIITITTVITDVSKRTSPPSSPPTPP